ncbi:MAG: hypothetical protein LUH18_06770 [Oscillospiraceae bacterium]|nr:hypothetical protein [Oscillospiraceae bacterium]
MKITSKNAEKYLDEKEAEQQERLTVVETPDAFESPYAIYDNKLDEYYYDNSGWMPTFDSMEEAKAALNEINQKNVEVAKEVKPKERTTKPKVPDSYKLIKNAAMDVLKGEISRNNDGMLSTYRVPDQSLRIMGQHKVRIEGDTVTQNGEPVLAIHRRYSAKKTKGCYRELTPTLEYIKKEQKQEKPSIREQLKQQASLNQKRKLRQNPKERIWNYDFYCRGNQFHELF